MNTFTTGDSPSPTPNQEQIAARARQIWNARGQPAGQDVEIWLEAERELRAPASPRVTVDDTVVQPTGRGVAKTRRSAKSLSEKVDQALSDRPGVGQGGHAKIVKQTT